jgi:hypothetical protein
MDANWGWAAGAGFVFLAWVAYLGLFPIPGDEEEEATTKTDKWWKRWWKRLLKSDFLMTRAWEGADGRASFSKFQFWLWTWVVVFALVSIWIARVIESKDAVAPIDDIPENLLAILGISVFTMGSAKVMTTRFAERGEVRKMSKKPKKKRAASSGAAAAGAGAQGQGEPDSNGPRETAPLQELVADDDGIPELAKIQMLLFTLVGVIVFLVTTADAINIGDGGKIALPDVDRSLLVLMGVSSGGYLSKKAITRERPTITSVVPPQVTTGKKTALILTGSSLGTKDNGVLRIGPVVYKEPEDKKRMEWNGSAISLEFDAKDVEPGDHPVEVTAGDITSKPKTLKVVMKPEPEITSIVPPEVVAGKKTPLILTGRSLGERDNSVLRIGPLVYKEPEDKEPMQWSGSAISFEFDAEVIVPGNYPVEVTVGDITSKPHALRVVAPGELVAPEESGKPEGDTD